MWYTKLETEKSELEVLQILQSGRVSYLVKPGGVVWIGIFDYIREFWEGVEDFHDFGNLLTDNYSLDLGGCSLVYARKTKRYCMMNTDKYHSDWAPKLFAFSEGQFSIDWDKLVADTELENLKINFDSIIDELWTEPEN